MVSHRSTRPIEKVNAVEYSLFNDTGVKKDANYKGAQHISEDNKTEPGWVNYELRCARWMDVLV